jgi:hypothetical protein
LDLLFRDSKNNYMLGGWKMQALPEGGLWEAFCYESCSANPE